MLEYFRANTLLNSVITHHVPLSLTDFGQDVTHRTESDNKDFRRGAVSTEATQTNTACSHAITKMFWREFQNWQLLSIKFITHNLIMIISFIMVVISYNCCPCCSKCAPTCLILQTQESV